MVRIESDLFTLKNASQLHSQSLSQLHVAVQYIVDLLAQSKLSPAVSILPGAQGAMQQVLPPSQLGAIQYCAPAPLQGTERGGATDGGRGGGGGGGVGVGGGGGGGGGGRDGSGPSEVGSSQEMHQLCPFLDCPATGHNCSAAASLRHMQTCDKCHEPFFRYLHITQHMSTFQKHPRVCDVDICCWCGSKFDCRQSQDARSRHRTSCRGNATLCLQVVT